MRQALRSNPARRQVSTVRAIPAPTGGWDTESPLANQKSKYALILDNWIPRSATCEMRRGFIQQASGFTSPVESLLPWRGEAAGDKLFAASGSEIYDVTDAGALGSAVYASAASAKWKATNFSNDAGAFLIATNLGSSPVRYDGTSFAGLTITGSSGPITLDQDDIYGVMSHKRRLWLVEHGTLRVWFLDVNAIQGAAELLDLGLLAYKGGYIADQGTWSMDGGQGMDDLAVWVTTEGQVIVYQGIDPTSADDWTLVGVYDLAKPLGQRSLIKWGSDLAVITEDGIVLLSQALNRDRAQDDDTALTARIASAFARSAQAYKDNYGWCGVLYSGRGSLAIFNVPTAEFQTSVQYVQSIQSGGWCRFTGIDAFCWELANDEIYFGSSEGVYRWDAGASDDGEPIVADVKNAFSAFGNLAVQKRFTMLQPILKAPTIIRPAVEMLVDYTERTPTAVPTVVNPEDIQAATLADVRDDWTSVVGIGYVGAPRMQVAIVGDPSEDVLAIDASDILVNEDGDAILLAPNLPLDVPVELVGYNVVMEHGSTL